LRELEEETGAVSIGRLKASRGASSSLGSEAGPSTLTSRATSSSNGTIEENRRLLPDFTLGSYEEALRTCQREAKIGCVILVSEEHDDVAEFKRYDLVIFCLKTVDKLRILQVDTYRPRFCKESVRE